MTKRSVKYVREEMYGKMRDIFDRQKGTNGTDNAVRYFELWEDVIVQILMEEEEKK